MAQRIQKIIADSGRCSRREAERLIAAGRVTVDGVTARIGQKAEIYQIRIDGSPLAATGKRVYIMLNKPRGYVTTMKDEKGRKTVLDLVEGCGARVFPVGRLDMASEGLLILTNDGDAAFRMTHPSFGLKKTYKVSVRGSGFETAALKMSQDMTLDGETVRGSEVSVLSEDGDRALFSVTVSEGKNRQVRRMCEACGLEVLRLERIREGELKLNGLKPGRWRYLTTAETEYIKSI